MSPEATALVVAMAVSGFLQMVKDHVSISEVALPWVGLIGGAVFGALSGELLGGETVGDLVTSSGIGALATTGTHSALLQDKTLGRVLKAVGEALFKKPS